MATSERVKIAFHLEVDEDGYPPVSVETLWAESLGGGRYRIDNIPFFVRDATDGDIVAASYVDEELRFTEVLEDSRNSLIRVLCRDGSNPQTLRKQLSVLGCETEFNGVHSLIAVSIPAGQPVEPVQQALATLRKQGLVDFEEPILWD
ncbi:MAG: DUF4265 domain-containing protein [Planctomycetota bacterium]